MDHNVIWVWDSKGTSSTSHFCKKESRADSILKPIQDATTKEAVQAREDDPVTILLHSAVGTRHSGAGWSWAQQEDIQHSPCSYFLAAPGKMNYFIIPNVDS